jgi:hypothetical protein
MKRGGGGPPPRDVMTRGFVLLLTLAALVLSAPLSVRRTMRLSAGPCVAIDGLLISDSDNNGAQELTFRTGFGYPGRWEIWEYRPVNRYELVFADTGVYPYPNGIATGNLFPFDVGDIDQDGRTDIVGVNWERANDTLYNILVVMESPDEYSYPESLVWSFRYGRNLGGVGRCYIAPDLDRDGKREIVLLGAGQYIGLGIWEPAGDSQYDLVWNSWDVASMTCLAFGDFDMDSLREFAGGFEAAAVYENTAPRQDSYVLTFTENPNVGSSRDQFTGQDLDEDKAPEFLISYYAPWTDTYTLMMWEATGNNTFERTLVDQRRMVVGYGSGRSRCGDLDGDGVDELVWAMPLCAVVYKAIGNDRFEQVWEWQGDHGTDQSLIARIADMNGNGYNELVVGGSGKTSVFEVEAIRVLYPDTAEEFCPGDTCLVQWEALTPPRCDSVSLFFLLDTVVEPGMEFYELDTIVTGLSPSDSVYPWIVPNANVDAAWILAMAYGPGWQFDRSDSAFSIHPVGMSERSKQAASGPMPEPTIVGGVLVWSATAPSLRNVGDIALQSRAKLLDASGRVVMSLQLGPNDIRYLSPGVYFVTPSPQSSGATPGSAKPARGEEEPAVRKVIIQR